MKIKDRLALYFTLISTITLLCVLSVTYFTFKKVMESEFFDRLTDRTMVTAKLYLKADEISNEALNQVRTEYLERLNGEVIRIYNDRNSAAFIGDDQQFWSSQTIDKVREMGKIRFKEGERQVVGIFYKDNQGDFVILASAIDQSTAIRVQTLLKVMTGVFIVIFLSLLLSGRWIAKRILSPLDVFINQVKLIKSNNLHFRVEEGTNKDEITLLAQNFNNLMEHLEHSFILQKTFVANASHELRTPVTRMIIGAEIALSKIRQRDDYEKALHSVLEDAEKLENIINALFNLAQADLEYSSSLSRQIRIDELIWQLQEEWNQRKGPNQLLVEMKNLPMTDETPLIISANPTLLQIALDNIIGNAFKFSDNQPVNCILEIVSEGIILTISDKGVGIAEDKLKEIFKPFYSSSHKIEHAGNGMGLYMANKIITLFNGKITVTSSKASGTTFRIEFHSF
ncbi:signal transduction histidine kinase [Pedobacter cryoconitis]|uniref:sensor histidine kinase n=1 Tax=Pedobacter cryoconitis TaxID=188932 RepID=UPI00161C952D|nr:HAMP domain-containing sensor histidine kinase [Pedobacter cryoconitis]MBB6274900.1 signal transduction histidine kinase [Pedobacter cryoconitis]